MNKISKKIKSIYLLAMMAILSVCVAVFPVFKTETAKAEEADFGMVGAYIKVDTDLEKQYGADKCADNFAIMFQAKFSDVTLNTIADQYVKFGMAIGPAESAEPDKPTLKDVTDYSQLVEVSESGNAKIFDSLIGNTNDIKPIQLATGEKEYKYEAGVYFNKDEKVPGTDDNMYPAEKDWSGAYKTQLIVIPFYTLYEMDGDEFVASSVQLGERLAPTSPVDVVFDTMLLESYKPVNTTEATPYELRRAVSDNVFETITGIPMANVLKTQQPTKNYEVFFDQSTMKFFANFEVASGVSYDATLMRTIALLEPHATTTGAFAISKSGWLGGQEVRKNTPNHTTAISDTYLYNSGVMKELVPGETYRYYNYNLTKNILYYYDYTVATAVFTAHDASSVQGKLLGGHSFSFNGDDAGSKRTYFALGYNANDGFYMPYTFANATYSIANATYSYEYEKENFAGYYVLAGNLVVPEGTAGATVTYRSGKTANTVTKDLSNTKAIGALKHVDVKKVDYSKVNVGAAFTGTFDGRGNTIEASFGRGGLFGFIKGGTVKNLNIVADFYDYTVDSTDSSKVLYNSRSYQQEAATLAEVISDGSTIENVSIKIKESAPKTFNAKHTSNTGMTITNYKPNFNNVSGVIAANGIYGSTLKNVIVECDTLKDVGASIQNYRAALNVDETSTLDNVFVIGSSYSNMSIDDEYTLTLSLPEPPAGFAFNTPYALSDTANATLKDKYGPMISDMYKWMRNEDVSAKPIKIKFVEEDAKHFADVEDFNSYITSDDNDEILSAFTGSNMWKVSGTALVWAKDVAYNSVTPSKTGPTIKYGDDDYSCKFDEKGALIPDTEKFGDGTNDSEDNFIDYYGWKVIFPSLEKYEVKVVLANGTNLITLPSSN